MASIQPVFSKIFEVKIGGRIRLSCHYLHVECKIFICLIYQKIELLEFLYAE